MKRYWAVYFCFIRNSWSSLMAFRANFFGNFFLFAGWVSMQIILIETVFSHTQSLAGWSRAQVYLVLGFAHLSERMTNLFFRDNLMKLPDMIADGELDLMIAKPISTLFYVSLRYVHLHAFINLYFPITVIVYAVQQAGVTLTGVNILASIVYFGYGIVIAYAVLLMLETCGFLFLRFSNVHELNAAVFRIGRNPLDIYGKAKIVFYTLIPVAFSSYLPARALMGTIEPEWLIGGLSVAALSIACALTWWRFALTKYSSASS